MKSNENCGGNSQKLLKAGTFSNYLSENSQGLELHNLKILRRYLLIKAKKVLLKQKYRKKHLEYFCIPYKHRIGMVLSIITRLTPKIPLAPHLKPEISINGFH